MSITAEDAKILINYCHETGEFRWNKPRPFASSGKVAGSVTAYGYWKVSICGRNYLGHRLAWLIMTGAMPIGQIDHANGDKLDNRFSNLRLSTPSQNQANKGIRKDNTSGVKGVTWDSSKRKWQAVISVDRRPIFLGRFENLDAAASAYAIGAQRYFGKFARPVDTR